MHSDQEGSRDRPSDSAMTSDSEEFDPYEDEGEFSEDEDDPTYQKFLAKYELGDTIGTFVTGMHTQQKGTLFSPISFFLSWDAHNRGGFSVVKRGTNKETGEKVAVKIVQQANAQTIMDREIEIMKKAASHPNILHLYDVFQTKRNIFLVMELAEGGEVFDHIVKYGEYSERDASVIARKIVEAVQFLHAQGIAHRDLKPQNLLCASDDPTDIRIADFGLSKVFNQATMMQTCCGSPEYVAPEILMCVSYDQSVDMWSIGIIIYILLTGCFPFWSENVQTLYQKIMNGAYRWPTKPAVSDSAKDLVRRLLEKDPKKRMTATECLTHPWITGAGAPAAPAERNWSDVQDARKKSSFKH